MIIMAMNVNGINNGAYMPVQKRESPKRETRHPVFRTALTESILL